jgi:hypothetical protein
MRIRKKFLQLTSYTYPNGTEGFLKSYLPEGTKTDKFGNFYYLVGDKPTTMFTCHLDTACSTQQKVTHVYDGNIIRTNGSTILGADDKAGMVVVMYMIKKKVPGLYYFFLGEEVGCIGSGKVSNDWENNEFSKTITKVVSFDRRGTTSVITHQWYGRCCSDEFAKELSTRLNNGGESLRLQPDDTGVLTDSAKFMDLVSECTNISVGYYKEHTTSEHQDIDYLSKLCKSVCNIDWETLPIKRDKYKYDIDTIDDDYDDYDDYDCEDSDYSHEYYSYFKYGDKTKKMYISKKKIKEETSLLYRWVFDQGYTEIKSINWNGHSLYVENHRGKLEFVGNRYEIMEMIPEIGGIYTSDLCDNPYMILS